MRLRKMMNLYCIDAYSSPEVKDQGLSHKPIVSFALRSGLKSVTRAYDAKRVGENTGGSYCSTKSTYNYIICTIFRVKWPL